MWEGEHVLLDGHNRYAICQKHGLPFTTRLLALPDLGAAKRWMLAHQLGRRNLTAEQTSYLRGKQYQEEKKINGGTGANRHTKEQLAQNEPAAQETGTTAERLAHVHKVGHATIKRDDAYANAIDTIAAIDPDVPQALMARDTKVSRQDVSKLATLARANPQTARHVLEAVQASPTPKAATRNASPWCIRLAQNDPPPTPPHVRRPNDDRTHTHQEKRYADPHPHD